MHRGLISRRHATTVRMPDTFTKRERQIMDILYRRERATAREVMEAIPDAPTNSTVRTQLRVLERKGYVRHQVVDRAYVYVPVLPRDKARRDALQRVIDTFFDGSADKTAGFLSTWDFRVRQSPCTSHTRSFVRARS